MKKKAKHQTDSDPYSSAMASVADAVDRGLRQADQMSEGEVEILENIKAAIIKNDPMFYGIIPPKEEGDAEG